MKLAQFPKILLMFSFLFLGKTYAQDFLLEKGHDDFSEWPEDSLLQNKKGLKIFWWNIERGDHGRRLIISEDLPIDGNPLEQNLLKLVKSKYKPDVLILGEYKSSAIRTKILDELTTHYKQKYVIHYQEGLDFSFLILSNVPFKEAAPLKDLHWTKLNTIWDDKKRAEEENEQIEEFAEAKLWNRRYVRFTVDHQGKKFNLLPVHLCQPWSAMNALKASAKIFMDYDNPLVNQLRRLISHTKNDVLKENEEHEAVLMLGDFNFPKSYTGATSVGYEYMTEFLSDAYSDNPATFPVPSDKKWYYPALKIDHAFVNEKATVKAAKVFPLKGSDHYPLYLIIE